MDKIKLFIAILIPIGILMMPRETIPIDGLTVIEQRFIAIFFLATLFWILEPIPIFATSVLIIFLELIMVSDKAFVLFQAPANATDFGTVLSYKEVMATFASPIILLFLGGFFLAMAATKYRLDINIARVMLKPFGTNPKFVLIGLMIITALFSMFMSNTATTAMMLAILTPVLKSLPKNDRGKIAFVLAIPFAANIGGIGTPIGTPPNAVAMKYLTGDLAIGFGQWMLIAVPFVVVMLIFAWLLLLTLYKPTTQKLELEIKGKFLKNWKAITVYITMTLTILCWLFDFIHGMNAYVVAMIPVAVFATTKIITTEDLKRISWDVLWLVSGGIALGVGLEKSGLAQHMVESIPFVNFPPLVIILAATLIMFLMANFMSHTATANLLLPIMAALGASLLSLQPLGGAMMLILATTFASSIAMSLPISTPPNAMAHATGAINSRHMLMPGALIGVVSLVGIYGLMVILKMVEFF